MGSSRNNSDFRQRILELDASLSALQHSLGDTALSSNNALGVPGLRESGSKGEPGNEQARRTVTSQLSVAERDEDDVVAKDRRKGNLDVSRRSAMLMPSSPDGSWNSVISLSQRLSSSTGPPVSSNRLSNPEISSFALSDSNMTFRDTAPKFLEPVRPSQVSFGTQFSSVEPKAAGTQESSSPRVEPRPTSHQWAGYATNGKLPLNVPPSIPPPSPLPSDITALLEAKSPRRERDRERLQATDREKEWDRDGARSRLRSPSPKREREQTSVAQLPAAPAPTNVGMYKQEFVAELQKQHQDRLHEAMEAASRIMSIKETEINRLSQKLKEAEERAVKAEIQVSEARKAAEEDVQELQRRQSGSHAEHEAQLRKQREQADKAIADLKERHSQELESARVSHLRELDHARALARSQQESMAETMRRQQQQFEVDLQKAEKVLDAKLKEQQSSHAAHVADLQRMLDQESTRLTMCREEVAQITLAKGNEFMSLKSQLEHLLREAAEKEKAHHAEVTRLIDELTAKDQKWARKEHEYQQLVRAIRQEQKAEQEHAASMVRQATSTSAELERKINQMQRQYEQQRTQDRAEIEYLTRSVESGQQFAQKHVAQNRELVELVRTLQRESSILQSELSLLENEGQRIREENAQFKAEIERLDRLIYGGRKDVKAGQSGPKKETGGSRPTGPWK